MNHVARIIYCVPLMMLGSAVTVFGQCHPASLLGETPDPASPYSYVSSFTKALAGAKEGADQIKDDADLIQMLPALRATKAGYDCAAFLMTPYLKSSNKAISTSAMAAAAAFTAAAESYDAMRKHFVDSIDAASAGTLKPGTAADRSAALMEKLDESGQLLLTAAVAATYSVVEEDPSTHKMSRLAMTAIQREKLKSELISVFGPAVAKGAAAGQTRLFGAAALIFQVVGDVNRRPRTQ